MLGKVHVTYSGCLQAGWLLVIERDKLWVLPDRPGMGLAGKFSARLAF